MAQSNGMRGARVWLAALVIGAAAQAAKADPIQTYVALGDALAFGQSTATPQQSYGDQGYVQQFANSLASHNNGIVPNVINLALPGETSSTYFSADNSDPSRSAGASANLNYGGDTSLSQRNFLAGVVAAEHASGHNVSTVSFALGLGDFSELVNSPAFKSASLSQQQAMVDQLLTTLKSNYQTALTQIRGVLPGANLFLTSYYNPYGYLAADDPKNLLTSQFVNGQLLLIDSLSQQFNAKVVDLQSAIAGHELQLTGVASGNPFPTAQGYTALANEIVSVANAPEPGTMTLMAVGAAGALCWARTRRRKVNY